MFRKDTNQIRRLLLSLMPIQALAFGLPAINSLLNSFIIGHFLGSETLATIGFIIPLTMAVSVFNVVLSSGAQVLSGNSLGRGDMKTLERIFNTTSVTAVVIGALFTVVSLAIPGKIAYLLGARDAILPLTASYIRGMAPSFAFSILFACFLPFIQLERASKVSTISVATMLVVNTVGNLLNAVVFKGGTFGAGVVTTISNVASVLACLPFFLFKSKLFRLVPKSFDFGTLRDITVRGYPSSVTQICNAVNRSLLSSCLYAIGGTPALAAMTVAINLTNSVGCTVEGGYVGSVNLISSVLVGERDVESLRDLPKQGITTAYPIYILAYVIVFVLAKPIATLCGAEPENVALYVTIIRLLNLWFLSNPIKAMTAAIYQALGRHKFMSLLYFMNSLVFPCLCMLGGLYVFHGVELPAMSLFIPELFSFLVYSIYYHKNRKRWPDSVFKLTDIPNSLAVPSAERYNRTFRTIEEVSDVSEGLIRFCETKGFSPRDSKLCGLCVEEMAVASLNNSLGSEKQKDFCIDLRVIHENGGITIMLRDNGLHFDPNEWLKLYANEDPMRCIGVKYVVKQAKNINYTSTLGLNVVVIDI